MAEAELLASLDDVKSWLPGDKFPIAKADTTLLQVEAQRLIKSQLSGVFAPVVLHGWDSPANTPDLIRGIAGRLIAAYLYREALSEDATEIPPYAQALYDEAVAILVGIRNGSVVVLDTNDEEISTNLFNATPADFWPNNTTEGPYFTMTQEFA